MTREELEALLRRWGRTYGERAPVEDEIERSPYGTNPIATAMQFAPGRRQAVIRERTNMQRAGQDRRRMMAVEAPGYRMLPASFVDPIRGKETRSRRSISQDWPVPPDVERVQRAALDLHALDALRGVCLRVQYCSTATLHDKALAAGSLLGSPLRVRAYREAVREARFWMLGRLSPERLT